MSDTVNYKKWVQTNNVVTISEKPLRLHWDTVITLDDYILTSFFENYDGLLQCSFPKLVSTGMYSLSNTFENSAISKFTCPRLETVDKWGMYATFINTRKLKKVNFKRLKTIAEYGMMDCFANSYLSEVRFPNLLSVDRWGMYNAFHRNDNIKGTIEFPKLTRISDYGMSWAFARSDVTGVSFPKLKELGREALDNAFSGCPIKGSVSFPELTTIAHQDALYNIFGGGHDIEYVFFPKLSYATWGKILTPTYLGCGFATIYWTDTNGNIITVKPDNINPDVDQPVEGGIVNKSRCEIIVYRGPNVIGTIPAGQTKVFPLLPSDDIRVVPKIEGNTTYDAYVGVSSGVSFNTYDESIKKYTEGFSLVYISKTKNQSYPTFGNSPFHITAKHKSSNVFTPTSFSMTVGLSHEQIQHGYNEYEEYVEVVQTVYDDVDIISNAELFWTSGTYISKYDEKVPGTEDQYIEKTEIKTSPYFYDNTGYLINDGADFTVDYSELQTEQNANSNWEYCQITVPEAESVQIGDLGINLNLVEGKVRISKEAIKRNFFVNPFIYKTSIIQYPVKITVDEDVVPYASVVQSRVGRTVFSKSKQGEYDLTVRQNDVIKINTAAYPVNVYGLAYNKDTSTTGLVWNSTITGFQRMTPIITISNT